MIGILKIRDFRLLFTGEGVSLLGDQFYFIALPWLTLELTSSTVVLGVVLALQGIPRAAFMLVGGAVTDRLSPRRVMIASNAARLAIVVTLSALVFGGAIQTWMLFAPAAAYGVADGFFYPAQTAIVPQLASVDQLSGANAFIQGLDQVAQFVGPILAGLLIAQAAAGSLGQDGIGVALAIDAATFAVSISLLALMRVDARAARRAAGAEAGAGATNDGASRERAGLWTAIKEGLAYMWADPLLRAAKLSCTPRPKTPPTTCQKRMVRKRSAWAEAAKQAVAPTLTAWFTMARARTTATVVPALMATAERVPRRAVRKRCAIVVLQSRVPLGLYGRVDGGPPI